MTDDELTNKYLKKWVNSIGNDYQEWVKRIPTNDLIRIVRCDNHNYDFEELKSRVNNSEDKLPILLEFPELFTTSA